jgi:disulfide bond formation protein DsbB
MVQHAPAAPRAASLALVLALAVPAAMGTALVAQFGFGLPPCEMCWWQRYGHIAAIALGVLALLRRGHPEGRCWCCWPARHLVQRADRGVSRGVEYHWWEGVTTCSTNHRGRSARRDLAAPLVRCDVPAWTLWGVSMAGFNFLFSTPAALAILVLAVRGGPASLRESLRQ